MKINKTALVVGAITTLGVASVVGLGTASADTNQQSSLVDKLVSKFNLNKADVQKVFDEQHAQMEADHKAKVEERLTTAVKDGKITEDQKTKILAKMSELEADRQANHDAMKDKTEAERKAAMEAKRAELKKWASDNNIPEQYLHLAGPGGPHEHGPH